MGACQGKANAADTLVARGGGGTAGPVILDSQEEIVVVSPAHKEGTSEAFTLDLALRTAVSGPITDASQRFFSTLKFGFNRRFAFDGTHYVTCKDTSDVVNALKICAAYDRRPTIGSGYHCYENFAVKNDGGILIDVSMMDGIYEHKELSTGRDLLVIEPGVYNWKATLHLFKMYGRSVPGGSCYSVCAGGHICGGGYGWLSRLQGLTVDYLYGVEVVTVDKRDRKNPKVTAVVATMESDDEDLRNLVWAHTGAGGLQFGVITKYFFILNDPCPRRIPRLPDAPKDAFFTSITWNWTDTTGQKKNKCMYDDSGFMKKDVFDAICTAYGRHWEKEDGNPARWNLFGVLKLCQWQHDGGVHVLIQGLDEDSVADFVYWMRDEVGKVCPEASTYMTCDPSALFHFVSRGSQAGVVTPPACAETMLKDFGLIIKWPWLTAAQYINGNPPNSRFKNTGAYHTGPFTQGMLDTLYKYATLSIGKDGSVLDRDGKALAKFVRPKDADPHNKEQPQQLASAGLAIAQIDSYGGRINWTKDIGTQDLKPVDPRSTAVVARRSIMKVQYQVYWNYCVDDELNLWWIKNFTGEMYAKCKPMPSDPHLGVPAVSSSEKTQGAYINYPDINLGNKQKEFAPLYFPDYKVYTDLQAVKRRWDPQNFFHFSQSIRLPGLQDPSDPDVTQEDFP